jgi:DNA polymerase-3 subunit epsilon
MLSDPSAVIGAHATRIAALVAQERFEEAGAVRDRLTAFLRGAARAQRLAPLSACPELVAARRSPDGGWEVVLIRYARLAATATVDRTDDPWPVIQSLRLSAEHVERPVSPAPAAHPEEADLLLAWLDSPGVRLVDAPEGWTCPVRGAQSCAGAEATAASVSAYLAAVPPDDTGSHVRVHAAGAA